MRTFEVDVVFSSIQRGKICKKFETGACSNAIRPARQLSGHIDVNPLAADWM